MSEDAQESCNKYIKRFREDFTRKCSRVKTMEDLFRRLLLTSDPLISSVRKLPRKKLISLLPEAATLLIAPNIEINETSSHEVSESSDVESDSSYDDN